MSNVSRGLVESTVVETASEIEVREVVHWRGDPGTPRDTLKAYRAALDDPDMPQLGAALVDYPGVELTSRQPASFGTHDVRVTLLYRTPTPADRVRIAPVGEIIDFRWRNASGERETVFDKDGNAMELTTASSSLGSFRVTEQLSVARVGINVSIAHWSIIEAVEPSLLVTGQRDVLNNAVWQTFPAFSWRVQEITTDKIDGRSEVLVHYRLAHSPELWLHEGRITLGGVVPRDAQPPDPGVADFHVLQEVDFSTTFPNLVIPGV